MRQITKISIIIPVYNVEKYIHKCLDTVINQTHKNLEIILVDDGSTDGSGAICDEYALKDNRVKVIHQQNQGVSTARNAALDIATGDYIGFVDPDDYIDLDMFEYLLSQIKENYADISICSRYSNEDRRKRIQTKSNYTTEEAVYALLEGGISNSPWDKIFSREIVNSTHFNCDIHMGEDRLFVWEVFTNSKKISYSPEKKYYYNLGPHGACLKKINERTLTSIEAFEEIYTKTQKKYPQLSSLAFNGCLSNLSLLANQVIRDNMSWKYKSRIISTARRYMRVKEKKSIKSAITPFVLSIGSVGFEFYAVIYKLYRWIRRK